ncbi:SMP-30/gluconolactonase/LRE family protein [Kutzneria sp. NPDC052558]|uniref:SMP-30/gluconolactonase/LRE family protein n=1 Tax=Kutzneria sp. NPDC052558 TaxID=3364121 RepID=UPI0037C67FD7
MAEILRFADGLFFPESPRWHDGRLWVVDITGRVVRRYLEDGSGEEFARLDTEPSGIGFAPDGRLLAVDMPGRRLLAIGDGVEVVADLSPYSPSFCNDMAVARDGTAYVTQLGNDHWKGEPPRAVPVIRVRPNGKVDTVGPDLMGPNGIVLSRDEKTVYVAEPAAGRVYFLRFDDAGAVVDHGEHVRVPPAPGSQLPFGVPDGIALDVEGALWIADPIGARVVRIDARGRLTDAFPIDGGHPLAVALGGTHRRTLYVVATANLDFYAPLTEPTGFVGAVDVAVPGCG